MMSPQKLSVAELAVLPSKPTPREAMDMSRVSAVWHAAGGARQPVGSKVGKWGQARPTRAVMSQVPSSVVHQHVVLPALGTTRKRDNFRRSRSRTPPWSSRSNHLLSNFERCGAFTIFQSPARGDVANQFLCTESRNFPCVADYGR